MHAVTCLPAVTGAWAHRGGGALWGHGAIYHLDQTLVKGLDRLDPSVRLLERLHTAVALRLPMLLNGPTGTGKSASIKWLAALSGFVSVVLALGPKLSGHRKRWLNGRFMTEQMRQWHFQTWLDGELVELAASDGAAFVAERDGAEHAAIALPGEHHQPIGLEGVLHEVGGPAQHEVVALRPGLHAARGRIPAAALVGDRERGRSTVGDPREAGVGRRALLAQHEGGVQGGHQRRRQRMP